MSIMPLGVWVGVSQAHLKTQATAEPAVLEDLAIRVSGNWRLTFGFDGADAIPVDDQDYH
jgi:plasmid maintenance system killer protein